MPNEIWVFAINVIRHWGSLLTGGAIAVAILFIEHWTKKNITWRTFLYAVGAAMFMSCFLAWNDEHHNAEVLKAEKSQLSSDKVVLQLRLDDKQSEIDGLRDELTKRPPPGPSSRASFEEPLTKGGIIINSRNFPSADSEAPYGLEITIQAKSEIQPTKLLLDFDHRIEREHASWKLSGTSPQEASFIIGTGEPPLAPNQYFVGFSQPAFLPKTPVVVTVLSKTPLHLKRISSLP